MDSTESALHLLPLPDGAHNHRPGDIWTAGTPLLIPLGAGLSTGIRRSGPDGIRELTTDDLLSEDTTVGELWADAALTMLATLGRISAVHGTALRQRRLTDGILEIGVIDDPFPAAGLIAHPLLVRPTLRVLPEDPRVAVTATGRLLVVSGGADPVDCPGGVAEEVCGPALPLSESALL
ncbi:hypothetical protein [uncultured Corynebacterium sp.]|uniref:hypothetical protein n=1 Tax=uncultured Corynebacterium sp. TaxID=159447 RepID=UPI0025DF7BC5|nr:hypothetical protein [uncultured Corynebacterium sp.]